MSDTNETLSLAEQIKNCEHLLDIHQAQAEASCKMVVEYHIHIAKLRERLHRIQIKNQLATETTE